MSKKKIDDSYYLSLHNKIKKFDYTIMSIVSDEPESSEHAAFCYTIGLSNYGHPEILFVDCYYNDVTRASDYILENISEGNVFEPNDKLDIQGRELKAIELKDGVKEELSAQAKHYFDKYRPNRPDYDLIYVSFSDELGIFPDEKIFMPSKHVKKQFFKQTLHIERYGRKMLIIPESIHVQ